MVIESFFHLLQKAVETSAGEKVMKIHGEAPSTREKGESQ
jgi:hypothetical protein